MTALHDAATLAGIGWHIAPIAPRSKFPSTALVKHGYLDATTDAATIAGWFEAFPEIGIGVALDPSNLLAIGPDSQAWIEEFERRGLPPTAVAESRPGHRIYYYKQPADCPAYRLCKSGEYDIMTNGGAALPPSTHPDTGEPRRWLVAPWDLDGPLPEAPTWAVAMLEEAVITAVPLPPASVAVDGDQAEPPVRLNDYDQEVWEGKHPARKPHAPDEVDRSETLWGMGMMLAKANAGTVAIATALAERDRTLGLHTYSGRRDGGRLEYWRIAVKVIDRVEREPAGAGADCPELRAEVARLRAENDDLRTSLSLTRSVLANQKLKTVAPTALAIAGRIVAPQNLKVTHDGYVCMSRRAIGVDAGCSDQAVSDHVATLERSGWCEVRREPTVAIDRRTGEVLTNPDTGAPYPVTELQIKVKGTTYAEVIRPLATLELVPKDGKTEWGGKREACPHCGKEAGRRKTITCLGCGQVIGTPEEVPPPCQDDMPQNVQGTGDTVGLVCQDDMPPITPLERRRRLRQAQPARQYRAENDPACAVCAGRAEYENAEGLHCRTHALFKTGGLARPLHQRKAVGDD